MIKGLLLLLATFAVWLVVGAAASVGAWYWWVLASVPMVALLAAPFVLFGWSGGRTWPTWVALPFTFVLMLTAMEVPADWYLRATGHPVDVTVGASSCLETMKNDRCLYSYTLHDASGVPLSAEFRDTVVYEPGSPLTVVVDPGGILAPRRADDLASHVFDVAVGVAFAAFGAAVLAALLLGRNPLPEPAAVPPPRRRRRSR